MNDFSDKLMESKFITITAGIFLGTISAGFYMISVNLINSLT